MRQMQDLINQIAQGKIDFEIGFKKIINEPNFNFKNLFNKLKEYIFNSIPNKTNYKTQTYLDAINSIPLKPTLTPVIVLKTFSTKIAFNKLEQLPENEHQKVIISLLWIFKKTDTERRNTECANGCKHDWHNNK